MDGGLIFFNVFAALISGGGLWIATRPIAPSQSYDSEVPWCVSSLVMTEPDRFLVRFKDCLSGVVRFEPSFFTGVFEVLKDPEFFKQVFIEDGAVTWPGEIDLAPDAMHDEIAKHGEWVLR